MATYKIDDVLKQGLFYNPKTGNVYKNAGNGELMGTVEGINPQQGLKSVFDLPTVTEQQMGQNYNPGSPFRYNNDIYNWGGLGAGLNKIGSINNGQVQWEENLFPAIQQSSRDYEAAGFGQLSEFANDPRYTSMLKDTDFMQAAQYSQPLMRKMQEEENLRIQQQKAAEEAQRQADLLRPENQAYYTPKEQAINQANQAGVPYLQTAGMATVQTGPKYGDVLTLQNGQQISPQDPNYATFAKQMGISPQTAAPTTPQEATAVQQAGLGRKISNVEELNKLSAMGLTEADIVRKDGAIYLKPESKFSVGGTGVQSTATSAPQAQNATSQQTSNLKATVDAQAQQLGDNVKANANFINGVYKAYLGRNATQAELNQYVGKGVLSAYNAIKAGQSAASAEKMLNDGKSPEDVLTETALEIEKNKGKSIDNPAIQNLLEGTAFENIMGAYTQALQKIQSPVVEKQNEIVNALMAMPSQAESLAKLKSEMGVDAVMERITGLSQAAIPIEKALRELPTSILGAYKDIGMDSQQLSRRIALESGKISQTLSDITAQQKVLQEDLVMRNDSIKEIMNAQSLDAETKKEILTTALEFTKQNMETQKELLSLQFSLAKEEIKQQTALEEIDTKIVEVGNKTLLINTKTGETIKELGIATTPPQIEKVNGVDMVYNPDTQQYSPVLVETTYSEKESADKISKANEILKVANELYNDKSLASAVGPISSRLPTLKGSTADFEAKYNQLVALLASDNLDKLKGAMSDKDIEFLKQMGSSLSLKMSENGFKKELNNIMNKVGSTLENFKATTQTGGDELDNILESVGFSRVGGDTQKALEIKNGAKFGQCGKFVNKLTGLGLGDSYASKMAKMDPSIKTAEPGMVFVMPYKDTGHTGFIVGIDGDKAIVKDSNWGLDEKVQTHKIALSKITGLRRV